MSSPPFDFSPEGSLADLVFKQTRKACERWFQQAQLLAPGIRRLNLDDPQVRRRFARTSPWKRVPYDATSGMEPQAWLSPPNPDPPETLMVTFCRPYNLPNQDGLHLPDTIREYVRSLDGQTLSLKLVLDHLRTLCLPDQVLEADLVYQDISLWDSKARTIFRLILFSPAPSPPSAAPFAPSAPPASDEFGSGGAFLFIKQNTPCGVLCSSKSIYS